jgi:hypothetical protein
MGLIQGLPLAARAQHREQSVGTQAVGDAGAFTVKAVCFGMDTTTALRQSAHGRM